MNTAAPVALSPDLAIVLGAVVRHDLALSGVLAQLVGRPVFDNLKTLCAGGYVRELRRQADSRGPALYTATQAGRALTSASDATASPSAIALPRTGYSSTLYDGAQMRPFTGRAGSMDFLKHPSRMGDRLYFRDAADDASMDGGAAAKIDQRVTTHAAKKACGS